MERPEGAGQADHPIEEKKDSSTAAVERAMDSSSLDVELTTCSPQPGHSFCRVF